MADKPDLVERRQKYIQRQIELDRRSVNVQFRGMPPQGGGPLNRHGMPKLPVGQHEVRNWPVLDLGEQPDIPLDRWRLEVGGHVANPTTFTWEQFMALPQVSSRSDIHCVTTWSKYDNDWGGVRFTDLEALVRPKPEAGHVIFHSYGGYTTNVPLAELQGPENMVVHTHNGQPLTPEHGGPCRIITPKLYAWKGAKWIRKIEFLSDDRKGFWEVRGYSNTAEPWFNDRYAK